MGLSSVVLVVVAVVLTTCDAAATTMEADHTRPSIVSKDRSSHNFIDGKRLLKVGEKIGEDDSLDAKTSARHANEPEERGALSSLTRIFSQLKAKVSNSVKTSFWVEFEKSDDAVKQKLGLTGLAEAKLTNHPNYKVYLQFASKLEGKMLNYMVAAGESTTTFWKQLGLRTDELTLEKFATLKSTPEFQTYMRYAKKYDSWTHTLRNGMFEPPRYIGGYSGELWAKAEIWATAGRSKGYVKEMLGLAGLSKAQIQQDVNFRYYDKFLTLANKKM